ncbi:thioredoxin-like 1-2, chloroplastic [Primulina huaijiensis]|uniref:thioredoxin-like 1-2, chloroplastic n=1 Tax=Primulina huaijiensis TaxID=1492673 RepID=UPI003CC70294
MSCLKGGFSVSGAGEAIFKNRAQESFRVCSSIGALKFKESNLNDFWRKTLDVSDRKSVSNLTIKAPPNYEPINAQPSVCISKAQRWWEKSLQPNMLEIHSAQELIDCLLIAGDRLVILGFYSPGCGGCKALHPKICQLAEMNPDSIFLKVNFEQHKVMCHALNVHVLPFFRFYRGADGKLCSFSCTNATIKKFKDAVAKHGTDRCSLGAAQGLNESELLALASNGLISNNSLQNPAENDEFESLVLEEAGVPFALA